MWSPKVTPIAVPEDRSETWGPPSGSSKRFSQRVIPPRMSPEGGPQMGFPQGRSLNCSPPREIRQGVFPEGCSTRGHPLCPRRESPRRVPQGGPQKGSYNYGCKLRSPEGGPTRGFTKGFQKWVTQGRSPIWCPQSMSTMGDPPTGPESGFHQVGVPQGESTMVLEEEKTQSGVPQGDLPTWSTKWFLKAVRQVHTAKGNPPWVVAIGVCLKW